MGGSFSDMLSSPGPAETTQLTSGTSQGESRRLKSAVPCSQHAGRKAAATSEASSAKKTGRLWGLTMQGAHAFCPQRPEPGVPGQHPAGLQSCHAPHISTQTVSEHEPSVLLVPDLSEQALHGVITDAEPQTSACGISIHDECVYTMEAQLAQVWLRACGGSTSRLC